MQTVFFSWQIDDKPSSAKIQTSLKKAIKKDLKGIYNLVSSKNITPAQIAELLGKKVSFGTYTYNVGDVDNKKASKILPDFKKTSSAVINEFRASG